jgi:hypothetical protein
VRPPFSPERVCDEFAKVLKGYTVFSVVSDSVRIQLLDEPRSIAGSSSKN